jgi:hypothetical protein
MRGIVSRGATAGFRPLRRAKSWIALPQSPTGFAQKSRCRFGHRASRRLGTARFRRQVPGAADIVANFAKFIGYPSLSETGSCCGQAGIRVWQCNSCGYFAVDPLLNQQTLPRWLNFGV